MSVSGHARTAGRPAGAAIAPSGPAKASEPPRHSARSGLGGIGRIGCALGVVPAIPLWAAHAVAWASSLEGQSAAVLAGAGLGALLGAVAADAITGLVHWACDTWGDEATPWVGPGLISAFREHHRSPRAMLEHDWIWGNRETGIAATAALLLLATPPARTVLQGSPALYGFVCWFIAYAAFANQLHRWAHSRTRPRVVRWLQKVGLILSPARHARHHRAPHTRAYCISTGWLNPPLDALGFWRALERAVILTTGMQPRRGDADRTRERDSSWHGHGVATPGGRERA